MTRNLIVASLALLLFACEGRPKKSEVTPELIREFLEDVTTLQKVENGNPISQFRITAERTADKVVQLDKDNVQEVLEEAKAYSYCVITTGDHTIVRIEDPEDCSLSGSWGVCMPRAEGYIKKDDLEYRDDFANNIIGKPDDQERTVYFFN